MCASRSLIYSARRAFTIRDFTTQAFYERVESPISSFLAGGQNGSTIQSDYTGTARLEGQSPVLGGNYRLDFSSVRLNTNNQFTALNPQFPTALTFSYTQPLLARAQDRQQSPADRDRAKESFVN